MSDPVFIHAMGSLALALVCSVVGGITLARAFRDGAKADFAFAGILLLAGFVATGLIGIIPIAGPELGAGGVRLLSIVSTAAGSLAALAAYAFTRRVFHAESRAASVAFWVVAVSLAATWFGEVAGGALGRPSVLAGVLIREGVYLWVAVSCALQYASGRSRVRFGLSDPLVVNRFLLLAGAAGAVALTSTLMILERAAGVEHFALVAATCLARLVTAICLWLACLPPESYLDWVKGRAEAVRV